MDQDDEKLESFLRRFEPRQPSPLARRSASPHWAMWIAAGLAAAVIGSAALVWRERPSRSTPDAAQQTQETTSVTAGRVARITNWDLDALDRLLSDASSGVLPDVESPEGALRVLAQLGDGGGQ